MTKPADIEITNNTNARFVMWMVVVIVVVVADQLTKWAIVEWVTFNLNLYRLNCS